ncbi:hypothetical protein, variant [Aphanomyces astaci]|uniref:Nudix hydrolase domain-containing protein n=1 Tax=Aphanomyces astaci TaxID=112090 RepID=W4GCE2_APHAT|nr:hypothetical protein, variant [Aphanomyces astaci]ETV77340.1 hypothetical protein, variant [Aphanomyces astaci]|eukprot:XP_009833127.1 hypothetical protein, variant [Aphanomyces astaci]
MASSSGHGPSKKRRTLADADEDVRLYQSRLAEATKKMIVLARENARMKVLLQKYLDKDDTLLSTSQMTMGSQLSQPSQSSTTVLPPVPPPPLHAIHESNSEDQTSSSSSYAVGDAVDSFGGSNSQDCFSSSLSSSMHDEFVFDSQLSQLDDVANTSHLDEILSFLDRQEALDHDRLFTMQSEVATLRESATVPRVGVGVLLYSAAHPSCVLIGVRKASHGAGKVQLPGGHLEFGESWEECAVREVKEETDLDIGDVTFAHSTNDIMPDDDKHYITIFMQATVRDGQVPVRMEPDKMGVAAMGTLEVAGVPS